MQTSDSPRSDSASEAAAAAAVEPPITDSGRAADVARRIAASGEMALDLEFASESRYIPELALVQVGWGDIEDPNVAAVDPLSADVEPLLAPIVDPKVLTVLHAGQGDLTLLADLFEVRAENVFDTQIAAAFLGLGDQLGYAALVEEVCGVTLDKGQQFTRWLKRPLTDEQIRYALDDVRYLPRLYVHLARRLKERGRLAWVEEECDRLAAEALIRTPPEEAYRKVGGWGRLDARQLGVLQTLAEWREERSLSANRPPSWILKNKVLLTLVRRSPESMDELKKVSDIPPKTLERHGRDFLRLVRDGKKSPMRSDRKPQVPRHARKWGKELGAEIQEISRAADIAPRFVAARADTERLVAWWTTGDRDREPDLPLLSGWRRQLAGEAALDWLRKKGS